MSLVLSDWYTTSLTGTHINIITLADGQLENDYNVSNIILLNAITLASIQILMQSVQFSKVL